jgi:hypothetical protein
VKEIKLNKGYVALVDDEDYERVSKFNWRVSLHKKKKTPYAVAIVKLHRLVMNADASSPSVDHKNRYGLDCQKSNLRFATRSQNAANQKSHRASFSKYKGVQWHKASKSWMSRIMREGKVWTSYHATELEAALAYDSISRALDREFANPNFQLCPLTIKKESYTYVRHDA